MGAQYVSLPLALSAGFLSFFSPCILPLIPAYIMYITGTSAEAELKDHKILAITRTFGFILGFTIVFLIMGLSASFLGQLFARNRLFLLKVSGYVMILFGLNMFGLFKFKLFKTFALIKAPAKVSGFFSSVIMGLAFAAGWTPCFGPVLASIVIYAGATGTVASGFTLLLVYSVGLAIPFMLTAIFINTFNKFLDKREKFIKLVPKISGTVLIIFGLLILTNKLTVLGNLLV